MKLLFKDKIVLIVGGTGGIGKEITKKISSLGAFVYIVARNEEKLSNLAKYLENVEYFIGDATNFDRMQEIVRKIEEKEKKIDVIIHAVGNILLRPLHALSEFQMRNSLNVNFMTAFNVIRAAIRGMMKQNHGVIVLISSVSAQKGMRNHTAIAASKAALEGMLRSIAVTYASKGIRINGVALGLIETPLAERNNLTTTEKNRKIANELHPLGRFGQVDDVIEQIIFLASDKSSWMTGAIIPIDGGLGAN